ncbi:hypothetical protein [Stackebrandtia nassauensis]|uniref:Uncharacterized protein n=1 Tax=Stackebrandtia nassauensis (strain DSM 44728 / CIP 108903 / NRRL B-16338 / NBRC 102104 / LLR-40K-21) TaxID=446470 RepID=D3QAB3_STANL|nr:hypothetical protein [Stackebrandtia nassauensis]ADD42696.1 hypothetical protein Snas_3025 [Stackebrandtia nassauensis DSM 44728]
MTTPTPYSSEFSVPPQPVPGATVTEDMLPPVPPRPKALITGLILLALSGLSFEIGSLLEVIARFQASPSPYGSSPGNGVVMWLIYSVLVCGAIIVLGRLVWLGSPTGLLLLILGTGYATANLLLMNYTLVSDLVFEPSPPGLTDYVLQDPQTVGLRVAVVLALPALIAFCWRSSRRWSRRAGMIRHVRGFIRKGRPVTMLPPAMYE